MAGLAAMSVPYDPVAGEGAPSTAPYDRAVRDALAELPHDVRAAWIARYASQEDAASCAEALVERAETALLTADRPAGHHTRRLDAAGSSCGKQ